MLFGSVQPRNKFLSLRHYFIIASLLDSLNEYLVVFKKANLHIFTKKNRRKAQKANLNINAYAAKGLR